MKKILQKINNKLYYFVLPDKANTSRYSLMEQINFNALLLTASLFSIIFCVFSFIALQDLVSNIFTVFFSVLFSYLYFLSRFKNYQHIWFATTIILIVLSLCWFVYGGAVGSTPYLYILFLFITIVISKPKQQSLIIFIYLSNLAILYFLEYCYGDKLIHRYNSQDYYSDMIFRFLLVLIATFFIMRFFKHMYEKERKKVENQNIIIAAQNEEHLASLRYAANLQKEIISTEDQLNFLFDDYFLLFKPRNIVSGDFYWIKQKEEFGIVVVADCTGHGVPAAFLSILGISLLDEATEQIRELWTASKFLDRLRFKFIPHFKKSAAANEKTNDSIDMGVLIIDYTESTIQFSGANRPLILIRDNNLAPADNYSEIKEGETHTMYLFKATKNTIGHNHSEQHFINHTIEFYPADTFYLFTDGYCDQFDTSNKKKFKIEQLKKELLKIQSLPMATQGEYLNSIHKKWKGDTEQTDDILIAGLRI